MSALTEAVKARMTTKRVDLNAEGCELRTYEVLRYQYHEDKSREEHRQGRQTAVHDDVVEGQGYEEGSRSHGRQEVDDDLIGYGMPIR
jgi:hypothetical protein